MDRMFVVSAIEYRPAAEDTSPIRVDGLGFSIVRFTEHSDGEGTGVRANLQIEDDLARMDLARHYTDNTSLEWTFEIGDGSGQFTTALQWTQFDLITGALQVGKTAVPRTLIAEAEGRAETDSTQAQDRRSAPDASMSPSAPNRRERTSPPDSRSKRREEASFAQKVSELWPRLFQQVGDLKSEE